MQQAVTELRQEGIEMPGMSDEEQQVLDRMHWIDDAVIDIELEAELPDSYVRQTAEKLKLYRELDSTKSEEALLGFEARLVDRFGPLPRLRSSCLT